jgi:hypothetical protein
MDTLFKADQNRDLGFICDIDDNTGYSPLFLEKSYNDYFLTVDTKSQIKNFFLKMVQIMANIRGDNPTNESLYRKIIEEVPHQWDEFMSNICFETNIRVENTNDGAKLLLSLQDKVNERSFSGNPLPWSFLTKDNKYMFGYGLENMINAMDNMKEAYQFTAAISHQSYLTRIIGRHINDEFWVEGINGYSKFASSEFYANLFGAELVGKPELSNFEITIAKPKPIQIPVKYLGGIWTKSNKQQEYTAEGQPQMGIFGAQENLDLNRIIKEFKVPRITYQGKLVIPINYGVSSAVTFINRSGAMEITRAHKIQNFYSISAADVDIGGKKPYSQI